ncbi:preprotein translocase subunit SecG [bacterium]|nr:preprotein translocase subunit SecG [bacterium]
METLIITIHYIACTILILSIMLQAGKGADIGAVFGGASQTLFGSRGPATFMNKLTIAVAVIFLTTSITLAQFAKQQISTSVIDDVTSTTEEPTDQQSDKPVEDSAE